MEQQEFNEFRGKLNILLSKIYTNCPDKARTMTCLEYTRKGGTKESTFKGLWKNGEYEPKAVEMLCFFIWKYHGEAMEYNGYLDLENIAKETGNVDYPGRKIQKHDVPRFKDALKAIGLIEWKSGGGKGWAKQYGTQHGVNGTIDLIIDFAREVCSDKTAREIGLLGKDLKNWWKERFKAEVLGELINVITTSTKLESEIISNINNCKRDITWITHDFTVLNKYKNILKPLSNKLKDKKISLTIICDKGHEEELINYINPNRPNIYVFPIDWNKEIKLVNSIPTMRAIIFDNKNALLLNMQNDASAIKWITVINTEKTLLEFTKAHNGLQLIPK